MATKNIRALSKAAAFAILASISFAVACGDDEETQTKPPVTTGGTDGNEGGSGGGSSDTGGSNGTGASDTGGLGGGGGTGTGGTSPVECFKNDGTCYELSADCTPLNSDEFKNATTDCDEDCVYSFDNSQLDKLNSDGSLPPLD